MVRAPLILAAVLACATIVVAQALPPRARAAALARAQLWTPTEVAGMDIMTGPAGPDAFEFRATVHCEYDDKELSGASPKFACRIPPDDEVKVKFTTTDNNGEVFAEVAASRLLWALGFGADHMYPVRVVCRGCPRELNGSSSAEGEFVFDPAVIERKMPGAELSEEWSWTELDNVDEATGGASRTHRDALKLLAVFLQHTDTKPQQQRLICLGEEAPGLHPPCARPFLMINDLGLTFGRSTKFNINATSSMNLAAWARVPVWKDATSCTGNLPRSVTGTLDDPVISEEGRRFLAGLLMQLTDAQIHDLFAVARVTLRARSPGNARSGFGTVEEWTAAFNDKRAQIASRRCA